MIKIYGKGDTVDTSEYWDGRDTFNQLSQFFKSNDNTIAVRNIFNDNNEMLGFMESINSSQFVTGGVVRYSFSNEFDIKSTDYFATTVNNITRYYVRCSPGIAVNNTYAYINKPATELASAELSTIFQIKPEDDEYVEIKYNYADDTFKGKVSKVVGKHMEIITLSNDTDYEDDTQPGYETGIELLFRMYENEFLTEYFDDTVGDFLAKIDLEKTVEVYTPGTYHWTIDLNGLLQLEIDPVAGTSFSIGNLTITVMASGINSFDNTHVYSGETETVSGDLLVTGDLTVQGTTTTINSEIVTIEDNIILLNSNQTGTPSPTLQSGIEVERGDEPNYFFIFDEATDTFMVGLTGSMVPLAGRQSSPTNQGVAFWDSTTSTFITEPAFTYNSTTDVLTVSDINSNKVSVSNGATNGLFIEAEKHQISSNDGSNFSIRVANNGTTGCTEAGMTGHIDFSQTSGDWRFRVSTAAGTVGVIPAWRTPLTISQTGDITVLNDIYADKIYGSVWNDIAEFMPTAEPSEPGDVLVMTERGVMPSHKHFGDKRVVGVHSDTFGYALNSKNKEGKTPVGLAGRVSVKIKGQVEIGDLLVSTSDGFATKASCFCKGKIIGKALQQKLFFNTERIEMLIMMA